MSVQHLTLRQLCDRYLDHAQAYYIKPSTKRPTRTIKNIRTTLKLFCAFPDPTPNAGMLFASGSATLADLPASAITAQMLHLFQQHLVRKRLSRVTIDDRIRFIKQMFKWAAHPAQAIIDPDVYVKLAMIEALPIGRTTAAEPKPVKAVPFTHVQATAAHAPPQIAAMIWTQWHSGMRPGEVCSMRHSLIERISSDTPDLDRCWLYKPPHKTEHHGKQRIIPITSNALNVLQSWLRHSAHSPLDCIFPGRWGDSPMSTSWYAQVINRINEKYGLDAWNPQMIRRAFATRLERAFDAKKAAKVLGHSSERTTQKHYIERDIMHTVAIMEEFDALES